ncbi:fimbrial protein [Siccibacter colletis]|uniref:fimbrial protein n=1 Tax=Siccibacter colletis TaxID=1505757 RepID=UPI0028BD8270|nr:fimbrial protein [Siccibacter colletis]WNN48394.1 fimbrial protein [Siccibacter colletis]
MKKKVASVFAPCLLLIAGLSQAADDVPATLSINGAVQNRNDVCSIELSRSLVQLDSKDINALPEQTMSSDKATSLDAVSVFVTGESCQSGGAAISFLGSVTDNDAYVFTNTQTGSAGAQGVGIALYGMGGEAITPNVSQKPVIDGGYVFHVGMVKVKNETPAPGLVQTSLTVQLDKV